MCKNKIYTVFLLIITIISFASKASELPNHYIIAFDRSVGGYKDEFYKKETTIKILDKVLRKSGFDNKRDYISIVGYTMSEYNPSVEKYVQPYKKLGTPILWYKMSDSSLLNLFPNWPLGEYTLEDSFYYSSLQSLAKPYSVLETINTNESAKCANKTFLYLVTDEEVNGADDNYRQEWERAASLGAYNDFKRISDSVFNKMKLFNEAYMFEEIEQSKRGISFDGKYKIVPYEVVPKERPSVHSITDIPSLIPIKRVKGGYNISIDAHTHLPKYVIQKIEIFNSVKSLICETNSGKLDKFVASSQLAEGDSISLELTVFLKDNLYNGVVISPDNNRYHDGMVVKQIAKIQNEAKILGILPLYDIFWWWFPNDLFTAVMVWDLIILLVFILIIGYILYRCFVRINTYKPSNNNIVIKKIE